MNVAELAVRIAKWEDLHTEFKEVPVRPDDLSASIVAFANTDGGQLILGVTDARAVVGVADPEGVTRDVDNVAANNCEPPVTVVQEVLDDADKRVVVINIPKGDQRPYRTNRGVFYIRTASGRRQASREELLRLFQATESLYYDETPVWRATLNHLEPVSFDRFLRQVFGKGVDEQGIPYATLLRNLGLLKDDHPTIAGLLFFGWRPQDFLPHAQINAARIPGGSLSAEPTDRKDFDGQLPTMLEGASRFLDLHLPVPHVIRGMEPERQPELPEASLREALVNALAHRDYTVQGPVRLLIFDDRVQVHTPGGLPNTVTVEAMRLGAVHIVRNPAIYTLFARLGLVTGIGSGVLRMIESVRQATGKEVDLIARPSEFVVVIPRRQSAS
jgi:ATP-dependent DNA helicase RecG